MYLRRKKRLLPHTQLRRWEWGAWGWASATAGLNGKISGKMNIISKKLI